MNKKHLFYTIIILFPFFASKNAGAQDGVRRQRNVTINQTIVDGKIISSDTIIFETDTMRQRAVQSKEINMELPSTKGSTLHIDNSYRKLIIRQSTDNKIRLSTTAFYYAQPAFTNEQWFEKLNIGVKNSDTGIVITSSGTNRNISKGISGFTYRSGLNDTARASGQSNGKGLRITQNGAFREVTSNGITTTQNGAYRKTTIDSGSLKGTTIIQNGATQTYTSGVPDAPTPPEPPVATSSTGVKKSLTISGTNIYGRATANGAFSTGNWINSGTTVAVFDEKGNTFYNSTSVKTDLTIYVPAGVKLDITSKYADVLIDHDVSSIKANITSASLDMLNATDAVIRSTYGTLSAGNITNADITSTSGKVFVKDIARLQLNTRYAKVEAGICGSLKTQSISDDYDIDEVKNFEGQKTYGNLRVDKLTGNFDFKGTNADLKIRNIEPSATAITIDNKYADVRLPLASLKNYQVNFSGNYASVSAPFERKEDTTQSTVNQNNESGNTSYSTTNGNTTTITRFSFPPRNSTNCFTATVGNVSGIHTIFKLVCNSCNVDFK